MMPSFATLRLDKPGGEAKAEDDPPLLSAFAKASAYAEATADKTADKTEDRGGSRHEAFEGCS